MTCNKDAVWLWERHREFAQDAMPPGVSIHSCSTKCIDSNGPKETQNPPCASRKKSAEKVVLHHRPYTVPWTAYASHTPYYPDYPAWVWCGFMAALEPTKETEGMPVQSFHIHPFWVDWWWGRWSANTDEMMELGDPLLSIGQYGPTAVSSWYLQLESSPHQTSQENIRSMPQHAIVSSSNLHQMSRNRSHQDSMQKQCL